MFHYCTTISDYSKTLETHTGVVGGATKAEQEQKKALEEQIAALQRVDEINNAKTAFESLTSAFREGILTEDQYRDRAESLNEITNLYTDSALEQATAQQILMNTLADPRAKDWYSQLVKNKDALDGVAVAEQAAAEKAATLASSETLGKQTEAAEAYRLSLDKIPKEVKTTVTLITPEAIKGAVGDTMEERRKQAEKTAASSTEIISANTKKAIGEVGDVASKTTDKVKGVADTTDARLGKLADNAKSKFGATATSISNAFTLMSGIVLGNVSTVSLSIDNLPTFKEFIYQITVRGSIPENIGNIPGAQHGADFIVPPNPRGRIGDYYPVIAAPGERVIVQTKAQQATGAQKAGNTYNYSTVNNVYNPLAAAMLADAVCRERRERSDA
jgi:hypothetical protein